MERIMIMTKFEQRQEYKDVCERETERETGVRGKG